MTRTTPLVTQVWAALGLVRLKALVEASPQKLLMPVHEGGANLSVGERQCVAMCRAVLQRAKVYLMDEATANVHSTTPNQPTNQPQPTYQPTNGVAPTTPSP